MVSRLRQGWIILFPIFIVYNLNIQTTVFAAVNRTLDNSDPSIHYAPPGAWGRIDKSPLDYKGSHMLTSNPKATASFNFTGTAIYFMSPRWPYLVNTAISLDHGRPTLVDLVDHSRPRTHGGPQTVQSHVVWKATGLKNTRHSLLISVGAGQPYAIVDGLIYTTDVTNVSASLPSSMSSTTTSRASPISTTSTTTSQASPISTTSTTTSQASPISTTSTTTSQASPISTTSTTTSQASPISTTSTSFRSFTTSSKPSTLPKTRPVNAHANSPFTLAIIFISLFAASLVVIFGLLWKLFGPRQNRLNFSPQAQRPQPWTIEGEVSAPLMPIAIEPDMSPTRPNTRTNSGSWAYSPYDIEDGRDSIRADPRTTYLRSPPPGP